MTNQEKLWAYVIKFRQAQIHTPGIRTPGSLNIIAEMIGIRRRKLETKLLPITSKTHTATTDQDIMLLESKLGPL